MKQVVIEGRRIEYRDIPARVDGRPVLLLLHEGLGCVAMWRRFPDRLAELTGCRVVVWSRAGYGGSDALPWQRTPDYMHREALDALPALLTALDIVRPVLIGHSDGGSIALIFAGAFPGVPHGVAVLAPHEFVEDVTLAGIRAARAAWSSTDLPARLGRYHADARRVFFDWNDIWLSPAFRDWNIEALLPWIRCPLLAIQGEEDEYATMRQIDVIAEILPQTRLLKLPDCGHSPQRDQEAAVLQALAEFVASLGDRSAASTSALLGRLSWWEAERGAGQSIRIGIAMAGQPAQFGIQLPQTFAGVGREFIQAPVRGLVLSPRQLDSRPAVAVQLQMRNALGDREIECRDQRVQFGFVVACRAGEGACVLESLAGRRDEYHADPDSARIGLGGTVEERRPIRSGTRLSNKTIHK